MITVPVKPEDREKILPYLFKYNNGFAGLSFGSIIMWNHTYPCEYAIEDNTLVIKIKIKDKIFFCYPCGENDIAVAEKLYKEYGNITFLTAPKAKAEYFKEKYPDRAEISYDRDMCDYVYEKTALSTLSGKKNHSKKNHVNKFFSVNGKETAEKIDLNNISECFALLDLWYEEKEPAPDIENEYSAVKTGLLNYENLSFFGMLLRDKEGKICAFSYGELLNDNTFVVHVEKADVSVPGSFAAINYVMANSLPEEIVYINREEDMGLPGLRKAKLSYNPIFLTEKYSLSLKG